VSDATAKELAALLALCRGSASAYRKMTESNPQNVALIFDALGERIAMMLERK
jgi:hypothetical protein